MAKTSQGNQNLDTMKINIIGGGPAGLYFALLMKKQNPAHEIIVRERNAPDDTFGWGVVFSDKTLSYLKETDEESYRQITDSFEMWDNVDVVHRGEKVTIGGNKFSGIARIELLQILQRRCRELGVDLRFRSEVSDVETLRAGSDLLVGADGINSTVRQKYAARFEPVLSVRTNRYIWYGTNQLFHGLTLTFHEGEAGVFAAHSYKFNKTTSTFIVECDEETWHRAGFAEMSDAQTRQYLTEVFRDDLNGHPLLSNNSKWINFVNVRNEHWSHRNVVLLGDALHTAHFSIGSGTKLALEDSIALYNCFQSAADVQGALGEFEKVRKPIIEAYQEAAHESLVWFEKAKDYMHLAPLPFAYSLMTRSKRIDYENLKRRDPAFIAAYERAIR
jgi:anthraniloyl-CoA monooxygenase